MKKRIATLFAGALVGVSFLLPLHAQTTAFTYQGRLVDGEIPVAGDFDIRFTLFDADFGGVQVGGILTNTVTAAGGVFTTTLDFGDVHNGTDYWLEMDVRPTGDGAFTPLSPRQAIVPTPRAQFADDAAVAASALALPASTVGTLEMVPGSVTDTVLADGAALAELADNDGAGSGLDADLLDGKTSTEFWQLNGNTATTPGTDFVGTTDANALEFRVNNQRVMQFLMTRSNEVYNILGGSPYNFIDPDIISATIAGGGTIEWSGGSRLNSLASDFTTISGGSGNRIGTNSNSGVISGGFGNMIEFDTFDATIGGGAFNTIGTNVFASTISGGNGNRIYGNAHRSTIGGGGASSIGTNAYISTISGGWNNHIRSFSDRATISGGLENLIEQRSWHATIGGGWNNEILEDSRVSTIAGGSEHSIGSNSWYSVIAGGRLNIVSNNASLAVINGGERNFIGNNSWRSTVGGGFLNAISDEVQGGIVGGGYNNVISTNADYAAILSGFSNTIGTNSSYSVIGGGVLNLNHGSSTYTVIGGGYQNTNDFNADMNVLAGGYRGYIGSNTSWSAIGGGYQNHLGNNSDTSVISGGNRNVVDDDAWNATIGGGYTNTVSGNESTVSGGGFNEASGFASSIPGGRNNHAAGSYSFAGGYRAKALHTGAFVWADAAAVDFESIALNEFAVSATGGARFVTGGAGLSVDGVPVLAGSVGTATIANGSITESKLAAGAVTATKLGVDAVDSGSIADDSIKDVDIAVGAGINATKLAAGVVSNTEFSHLNGVSSGIQSQLNQKLNASGGTLNGDLSFASDTDGIQFSAAAGTSSAMITMFASGVSNAERSVIAHSPSYQGYGLAYRDAIDTFVFQTGLGDTTPAMAISLPAHRVGIGRIAAANALEVTGNASKTTAGTWIANSDRRIKEDIQPVENALDQLTKINLVSFRYTEDYAETHHGVEDRRYLNVVAQEFAEVFPEHVKGSGETLEDGSEILQVDTYPLTIYSAAAIQELNKKVESSLTQLGEENRKLRVQNAELLRRLERLEQSLN